ncbi:hypothetical protein HDU99_006227, partial [Rhizoclosmatium hyalinum]
TTPPLRNNTLSNNYTQHLTNPLPPRLPSSSSSSSAFNPHNPILHPSPSTSFALPSDLLSGSLVGSYEESILNGRMSSLPSKPVRFTAELHAVAVGKVKNEKLKNVKPIRLGFDACFYELGGGRSAEEEFGGVSPYVGNVDVEGLSGLIDEEESDEIKKMRDEWIGGWRVPPRGQIQVLVKNSVGTAVKCFLLPYDFRDMPPGTKTFLRQKCFVGKLGAGKERLRDAIHVHFQCTSRKRVYLTRQIRVVFGGKGVEGDEKGRVITEGPGEPKYIEIPGGATPVFLQRDDGKILSGREEILSGSSPSRRSFSGGSWLGGGGSLNGGSVGGFASATAGAGSIPRRSSLGVSMMQF